MYIQNTAAKKVHLTIQKLTIQNILPSIQKMTKMSKNLIQNMLPSIQKNTKNDQNEQTPYQNDQKWPKWPK